MDTGSFSQLIDTTNLGTGGFTFNITSVANGDYIWASTLLPFNVTNANLMITPELNATAFQAYYPTMNNCTGMVTAYLECPSSSDEINEANVTWSLGNRNGTFWYKEASEYVANVTVPFLPGNYPLWINASLSNHNKANTSVNIIVEPRKPNILFTAIRTAAAFGDFIELAITVTDTGCFRPVFGKEVSIFILNQTNWILLTRIDLDANGLANFVWQAQDVGDDYVFSFKAVFHGDPEFNNQEQLITVDNTRNIRFIVDTIQDFIRGRLVNFTLLITTLDYIPIPNLSVNLIEISTNQTWCTTYTNISGHAYLTWNLTTQYELGEHKLSLMVQDSQTLLGTISMTIIVYEATILRIQ